MENIYKRILEVEEKNVELEYPVTQHYEILHERLSNEIKEGHISLKDIEKYVQKPVSKGANNSPDYNEDGDPLINQEFEIEPKNFDLASVQDMGWITEERKNEILKHPFYNDVVIRNNKNLNSLPKSVSNEIQAHSFHILGRCNDPKNWEVSKVENLNISEEWKLTNDKSKYYKNKQGLVYGMVQSGKTASMLALIGQAAVAGYKLFIVLTGGSNTSLAKQTIKRVSEGFKIRAGHHKDLPFTSIVDLGEDYLEKSRKKSAEDLWQPIEEKETCVICIMKETNHLKKLLDDLKELKEYCKNDYKDVSYDDIPTLIIDDEADSYSQNNNKPDEKEFSKTNKLLNDIRKIIPKNTYVAYTATPQRCIAADPNNLIGYPNDFLWLLDPNRHKEGDNKGETTSYLGNEEFFRIYNRPENRIIRILDDKTWPFYKKNKKGKSEGIYRSNGEVVKAKLTEAEQKRLDELLSAIDEGKHEEVEDFTWAIAEFLYTCGLRWYRFYKNEKAKNPKLELPTSKEIQGKLNEKGYPYHSMMIHLSRINEIQHHIVKMIEKLLDFVKDEFYKTKKREWESEYGLFERIRRHQNDKTKILREKEEDIEFDDLVYFIEHAIKIAQKTNNGKKIYTINSTEGETLNYSSRDYSKNTKKAAIIVGGNILSRGLTIENLSVSVFARCSVMSLADTNLQMCRWYGHKKMDIDLISIHMQSHAVNLFERIAQCDKHLRQQFQLAITEGTSPECLLLELLNDPLFKVTNPRTNPNLKKIKGTSFAGRVKDLLEPATHSNYLENHLILEKFINKLEKGKLMNERAIVYKDVNATHFLKFLEDFKVKDDNSIYLKISEYIKFLKDWKKEREQFGDLPKINLAVFKDQKECFRTRRLKYPTNLKPEEIKKHVRENYMISRLRGGKQTNENSYYAGDTVVDIDKKFHKQLKKNYKRRKTDGILVMVYKLDPNMIDKDQNLKFEKGEKGYLNPKKPIIALSIATPNEGPMYSVYINDKMKEKVERCKQTETTEE